MTSEDLTQLVAKAQGGDGAVREALLEQYRPFVAAVASAYSHRSLDWYNDDELSIGLLAFNEAIDTYKDGVGASFLTYSRLVIRHRLYDYFRKEKRNVPALSLPFDDGEAEPGFLKQAWEHFQQEIQIRERREELLLYQEELKGFGLSLAEVARVCPKQRRTRRCLIGAAAALAADRTLAAQFKQQGRLPLQELSQRLRVNRKTLERGRKYIVAVALILLNEDYTNLREYLRIPVTKEGVGNENSGSSAGN